jgi:hypothetical protein
MSGKGDKPRPIVDRKQFEENWDLAFGKKEPIEPPPEKETDDLQV